MKEEIVRFGVSLPRKLKEDFDRIMKKKGYRNRSKFIADLIRKLLVEEEWEKGKEVVGVILLIYNHHQRELVEKILDIQHHNTKNILSTQHIHLDRENCLEITIVRGKPEKLQKLWGELGSLKGVKFSNFLPATTGKNLI